MKPAEARAWRRAGRGSEVSPIEQLAKHRGIFEKDAVVIGDLDAISCRGVEREGEKELECSLNEPEISSPFLSYLVYFVIGQEAKSGREIARR